ncbi:MAG: hypothetical protein HUJ26_08195 [Planctomycetaceae bacterium]|nr:hypothetical protein [Planctomycetaceae bacterium]
MANLNESLTIKIQGDSSGFSRELDQVVSQVTNLESRLNSVDSASQRLASSLQGLRSAMAPINRISQALEQVKQQMTSLSSTPITLNVQPALNALQSLQAQIAATRAQLQALQGMSATGAGFGGAGAVGYAHGGLVNGRPGLDRIPAMLTAGEFVVRESSVNQLGVQFLSVLNERGSLPQRSASRENIRELNESDRTVPSPQTHFGGVNIHVRQTTDLPGVIRELQAGGVRLRNRRG